MEYKYGDEVVFTDEFGNERVSYVVNTEARGQEGLLGMHDSNLYGCYVRTPDEVRFAYHHDSKRARFNRGILRTREEIARAQEQEEASNGR